MGHAHNRVLATFRKKSIVFGKVRNCPSRYTYFTNLAAINDKTPIGSRNSQANQVEIVFLVNLTPIRVFTMNIIFSTNSSQESNLGLECTCTQLNCCSKSIKN